MRAASIVSNNAIDTVHAAANAIASAEARPPQPTVQKRGWGSCLSMYWCFGSHKNRKRIGHADLVPGPTAPENNVPASQNPIQEPTSVLPFVAPAPPSSPASFLQSETPSAAQSPPGLVPLNSIPGNVSSPVGPSSIFAIGPYAHETQLVSPPVFSTFTTEPSTAPFTPPTESVHLTTPSSPEVPFAQLLEPDVQNGEARQKNASFHYDFFSYQLPPGSPVGQVISPSPGISGTSSPFPDHESGVSGPQFLEFWTNKHSKFMNLGKFSAQKRGSRQGSGTLTPEAVRPKPYDNVPLDHPLEFLSIKRLSPQEQELREVTDPLNAERPESHDGLPPEHQTSEVASSSPKISEDGRPNDQLVDHRVSFELTVEDAVSREDMKAEASVNTVSASAKDMPATETKDNSIEIANDSRFHDGEISNVIAEKAPADEETQHHQKHQSITLGCVKDYNFENADRENFHRRSISSDWWANDKVVGKENEPTDKWAVFPVIQTGVS